MSKSTEVILEGVVKSEPEVVSAYGQEKIYSLELGVKRLSGVEDVFSINYSSGLGVDIKQGDSIYVEGTLRSAKIDGLAKLFINSDIIKIYDEEQAEHKNFVRIYNGELLDAPSLRKAYNNNNVDVCDFCVKVQRTYNKSSYVHCSAWKNNARLISKMNKGDYVSLEGRLQSHVNKVGNTVVNMSVISFIEKETE